MTKSYMDRRFDKMKHRSSSTLITAGMFVRIFLLLVILAGGKFFCDWTVGQSHNTVPAWKVKQFSNKKLREQVDLRTKGLISEKELSERADSITKNAKRDYINERK